MKNSLRVAFGWSSTNWLAGIAVATATAALVGGCANTESPVKPAYPTYRVATACPTPSGSVPAKSVTTDAPFTESLVASATPTRTARDLVGPAYLAAQYGRRDEAIRMFELAVRFPDSDQPIDRVQWSYGWGMFALGEYACAVARFEEARRASPDTVSWLPQTLAIAYWRLGEREVAVDWYNVAVGNLASCWANLKSAAYCTRSWKPHEQKALFEVATAWRAQRFQN
jgi:tetratricopeptide (TPR) repeat protein